MMNEGERKTLRAWMEGKGLRALMARIFELGETGMAEAADAPGPRGRTRLALDDADAEARDRLTTWMRGLDLEIRVDAIGNIFGVLPAAPGGEDRAPLMIGSHIDTVGNAGPLDGVYGVLAGLTVLHAFRAVGVLPPRPLIVTAFTNEEGVRYQPDMMGSLVYAGGCPLEKALDTRGMDGSRLGDELERIGYAGTVPPGHVTPFAYLELHVEQGPALDHDKVQIGVSRACRVFAGGKSRCRARPTMRAPRPQRCGMMRGWPQHGPTCSCVNSPRVAGCWSQWGACASSRG